MAPLALYPDRLLPVEPQARAVARRLYDEVRDAPIYSPHGHVDPGLLVKNEPFADPTGLLITPDHYVTRLLHANGVDLRTLGVGADSPLPEEQARSAWRTLCRHWSDFAGTPVRYWLTTQLVDLFGVSARPSEATADAIYDQIREVLASEEFRPRALFRRFGIRVLATTDDPADDLAAHQALRNDHTFDGHVLPTLRADRYMDPSVPGWSAHLDALATAADVDCGTYEGLLQAMRLRRQYFLQKGATATDTGVLDAGSDPLPAAEAERIHRSGLAGTVTPDEATAYRRNMLFRFAEMSCDDGLVMQLHPGVLRNHHRPTYESYGPDTGHDVPDETHFSRPLRPLLNAFGTDERLHLVLFTVDETTFAREIAPLAGFYPSVYAGAPWWFLDTPAAITRYREAVTDSAGFTKTSGFIDDTRAFCSIPARHDMARRVDAAYLASLVGQHQLDEDEAVDISARLVRDIPVATFRLERYV